MKKQVAKTPILEDWHLWSKVTRSISPLRKNQKLADEQAVILSQPEELKTSDKLKSTSKYKGWVPSYTPVFSSPKNASSNIEPRLRRRLSKGRVAIDATLDLHDLRQDEAHATLVRFLSVAHARQNRTVLVITGKGKKLSNDYSFGVNSQRGVLRAMLPIWLQGANLRQIIAGHETASQAHGGEGAFYVRLKKQNK